jgi:allograft inflammatory factor 1
VNEHFIDPTQCAGLVLFIDEMELKQMLEKLGTPKTHKEVKKMIHEVDTTDSGTISYREFLKV